MDKMAALSDLWIRGIFYDGLIFSPSESGGFSGTTQYIMKNKTKQKNKLMEKMFWKMRINIFISSN